MPIEKKHLKNDDEHNSDSAHKGLLDSANSSHSKKHIAQSSDLIALGQDSQNSEPHVLFDLDEYIPSEKTSLQKSDLLSDTKVGKAQAKAQNGDHSTINDPLAYNNNRKYYKAQPCVSPTPEGTDNNIKSPTESRLKVASLLSATQFKSNNSKPSTNIHSEQTQSNLGNKSDFISTSNRSNLFKESKEDMAVLGKDYMTLYPNSKKLIASTDANNSTTQKSLEKNDKAMDSSTNDTQSKVLKDTIATTTGKGTTTDSLASAQTQSKSTTNELNTPSAKPLSSIAQSNEHKQESIVASSSNTSHEIKQPASSSNRIAPADIASNPEVKISKSTAYVKEDDDFLKRPKFGGAQTVAEASPPPIIAQPLRFNSSSSMARDTVSASQDMIQSLSDLLKSQSTRQANPEIASKPTADSSKNHIESNQHSSGDKTAASFSKMLSNISPSPTDSAIANHQKQDSLKPPSSLEINADKLIAARGLNPSPPSSVNDLARSSTDTTKAEIKSVSDLKSSPTTSDKEISRDKTEHSHQDNSQSKSRPEGKSAATDNTDTSQKNQRHNEKQDDRSNKDTASNQDKSQRPSDKLSDKANDTQNKNDHKPDHKIDNKNQDQPDGKDKVQGKQIKSDQAKPDQADNNNPNLRGGKKGADNIGAKDSTIGNKANNINNKPDMLIMDETKKRADANELPPVLAIGAAALAGIARHTEKVIEEVEAIKAANKDSNGTSTKRRPYIVRLGDSLNSIAKNTLGDKRFANLILTINRARIRFKTDGTDYDAPLETGLKIALPSENEALIHKKSFFAE